MDVWDVHKVLPHHLTGGWQVYYGVIAWADFVQIVTSVAMISSGISALRRYWRRPSGPALDVTEPVAVVVPCYLPNEAPIIFDTIAHLLENMRYVKDMRLYLVYNSPKDMPDVEAKLQDLAQRQAQLCETAGGPRLHVERVMGSTSKAENLNAIMGKLDEEYITIYDADHCPDPDSLAIAIWYLKTSGVDCVQGSTYIRKGMCPFKSFVCAEFFINYFVVLPAMQALTGTGFFGGANGVWRGSSLRQLRFDEQALTEDIDCFARAVVQNKFRFVFMPECASGELLPAGPRAFWRQRLRWAMGWDQVTLRHATEFYQADVPLSRRIGLWYIFFGRWLSQLCAVVIVLFNAKAAVNRILAELAGQADVQVPGLEVPSCIHNLQYLSFCFYLLFITFAVVQAVCHSPFGILPGMVLYFSIMPFYVVFNTFMLSMSLFRVVTGKTGAWVVTSRATGPAPLSGAVPLLQKPAEAMNSLDPCARRIVATGFVTLGAIAGAIVGDVVGTHQEVHPLWGFVPFNIGATVTFVTDGRIVALCTAIGMAVGLSVFYGTMMMLPKRESVC